MVNIDRGKDIVIFTSQERLAGSIVANTRQNQNIDEKCKPAYGAADRHNDYQVHVEGALGELAFTHWLGEYPWNMFNRDLPDVGPFDVKTVQQDFKKLLVPVRGDPDAPFVSVCGENGTYKMRGWIYRHELRGRELWNDDKDPRHETYWVPKEVLTAMIKIPRRRWEDASECE